jgi:CBS domain-containing protein
MMPDIRHDVTRLGYPRLRRQEPQPCVTRGADARRTQMKARDLMTPDPAQVTPSDTLQRVSQLMAEHDCGCIPVVAADGQRSLVGVVTDRDIALRAVAEGRPATTPIGEIMTPNPDCCSPDDDVSQVEKLMSDRQIRRVVVVDGANECVGIIAQADLARAAKRQSEPSPREMVDVLEKISRPTVGS